MVPEGWCLKRLGTVAEFQRGFDLPSRNRIDGIYSIVSSGGISGSHSEFKVKSPGVVTGRYGSIGEVFYLEEDFWPLNTSLWVKDFHENDPKFIYYFLSKIDYKKFSDKTGVPGVNRNDLHSIKSILPPLPEQKKIAKILSTWDQAIAITEKLLANSQQQKKALMQQLLSGKKRFPGFSEKWTDLRVDDFIDLGKLKFNPKKSSDVHECIELEHIEQESGRLSGRLLTKNSMSHKNHFGRSDVLFGKLRPYLRKYWYSDRVGVCSTEIWVFHSKDSIDSMYLFQLVQSDQFIDCANISSGTHMPRADWGVVRSERFKLPSLPEQQQIASILSSADREIELFQQKIEHLKQEKKALMQQLLTGKRRVKLD